MYTEKLRRFSLLATLAPRQLDAASGLLIRAARVYSSYICIPRFRSQRLYIRRNSSSFPRLAASHETRDTLHFLRGAVIILSSHSLPLSRILLPHCAGRPVEIGKPMENWWWYIARVCTFRIW